MNENLRLALQITAIGMSLIFAALGLLWLVLVLLVRFTADRPVTEVETNKTGRQALLSPHALKQRAAVVAVAAALAQVAEGAHLTPRIGAGPHAEAKGTPDPLSPPPVFPPPPTSNVSAWQAVMRGRQIKQRGPVR